MITRERDDCLEKIADFIYANKNPDIIYSNLKIIKNNKISRIWVSGVLYFKNIKKRVDATPPNYDN